MDREAPQGDGSTRITLQPEGAIKCKATGVASPSARVVTRVETQGGGSTKTILHTECPVGPVGNGNSGSTPYREVQCSPTLPCKALWEMNEPENSSSSSGDIEDENEIVNICQTIVNSVWHSQWKKIVKNTVGGLAGNVGTGGTPYCEVKCLHRKVQVEYREDELGLLQPCAA